MMRKCLIHNTPDDSLFDMRHKEFAHKSKFHIGLSFRLMQENGKMCIRERATFEDNRDNRENDKDYRDLNLAAPKKRRKLAAYWMLFEHSRDSVLCIDSEGHILEANMAALKAYGYTREELCGMKIHDLRAEKTRDLIDTQMQEAYDKGITFKTCHVRKNGEDFPVDVSSHRIGVKSEKVLLSIVRDITEGERLENEFVKIERLKAIEKVASGLAHEIRNSITSVHGFLQLAENQMIDQRRFVENCNLMRQELDHANYVITGLTLVSNGKGIDQLKVQNLNHILLALFPSIQAIAEAQNKRVEIFLEETLPIHLDQKEIKILVNHLINNALESMLPRGKVTIRTHNTDNTLILSIKDNGGGIKPEIRDKLGIPFFTTKDTGTGLGLVICKSIAIRHNATMRIVSSDLGTTVQVVFNMQTAAILSGE